MIEEYMTIEPGIMLYVEAREPNTTRLFIRSLWVLEDNKKKQGWWNIFTICNKPVEKEGMYIARIDRHTYDNDGHDMLIVTPIAPIPANDVYQLIPTDEWLRRDIIQEVFLLSHKFSEKALHLNRYQEGNNWLLLYKKAKELDDNININRLFSHSVEPEIIGKVVDLVIAGKMSMVDVVTYLRTPTDHEIAEQNWKNFLADFVRNIDTYTAHPLLAEHIKKHIANYSVAYVVRTIDDIIGKLSSKYASASGYGHMPKVGGDMTWNDWDDPTFFDKLEAYLKFDAERKTKNKAAKKAVKKDKKAAAKATKEANN